MRLKILIPILMVFTSLAAQDRDFLIRDIAGDIESWKNRTIEMNLRLNRVDYYFNKIVFYDSDNINIEFSIEDKKKQKELSGDLLNAHHGVLYKVKFTVLSGGSLGGIIGDLHGFTPVYADKIPEDGK